MPSTSIIRTLLWSVVRLSLRRLDQLLAKVPELLCQLVTLCQFARLLLVAVSKVFSCHSPQLWVQSYVTSSCCSLKNESLKVSVFCKIISYILLFPVTMLCTVIAMKKSWLETWIGKIWFQTWCTFFHSMKVATWKTSARENKLF